MKVHEFIEFLKEIEDQDAEVMVVEHRSGDNVYDQGGTAKEVGFNSESHIEYTDFRGNQHVNPAANYFNGRFLLIGAKDP